MKRKAYEKELRRLQVELVSLQEWVKKSGARVCIVFEGRDTAGKGGTIKALTNPAKGGYRSDIGGTTTRQAAQHRASPEQMTTPTPRRSPPRSRR